jgi:hypothetical protein
VEGSWSIRWSTPDHRWTAVNFFGLKKIWVFGIKKNQLRSFSRKKIADLFLWKFMIFFEKNFLIFLGTKFLIFDFFFRKKFRFQINTISGFFQKKFSFFYREKILIFFFGNIFSIFFRIFGEKSFDIKWIKFWSFFRKNVSNNFSRKKFPFFLFQSLKLI